MGESRDTIVLSVVSGKGGVGKTMVCSNIAWVASQFGKTLLVDLDFHNQGCTGLYAPHFDFADGSAISYLEGGPSRGEPTRISDTLDFLPAISWKARPNSEDIFAMIGSASYLEKFKRFLYEDVPALGYEIVILDCHGGVDPVSYGAFIGADHTLMVTEADSVTFAGTLELLDFYEETWAKERSKAGSDDSADDELSTANQDIKFIVNRLPPKYRFKDLERLYAPLLQAELGRFR